MTGTILALNAGSSSVKFAVFSTTDALSKVGSGEIDGIGRAPALRVAGSTQPPEIPDGVADHSRLIAFLLEAVIVPATGRPLAVGHRVVHGGTEFDRPVRIDAAVVDRLSALEPLARSHQPHNIAGIRAVTAVWPDIPQVACFDTAFHRTLPEVRQIFAIPRHLTEAGMRRYGFHGLSYDSIARRLPDHLGTTAEGRIIVAHLGNGASLCAMVGLKSRHTTMGFTPLDGLVMGRRPGRLDPGVILHLMRDHGMGADDVARLLHEACGLFGVSGASSDMRDLLASDAPAARLAADLFVDRLVLEIGAAAAAIGGLDALVFTGGIGENAAPVRERTVARLGFLGAALDRAANERGATDIGAASSRVRILVLSPEEERLIAGHAREALVRAAP